MDRQASPADSSPVSVAAIIVRGNRVLVAKRKPGGDLGGLWEFPGGKREPGERNEDAIARELDEEFGVKARAILELGRSSFAHHGRDFELIAFETNLDGDIGTLAEHDEIRFVDADGLERLPFAPSDTGLFPFVVKRLALG